MTKKKTSPKINPIIDKKDNTPEEKTIPSIPLIPKAKIEYNPVLAKKQNEDLVKKLTIIQPPQIKKKMFTELWTKYKDKILYVPEFIFVVFMYGFLINFSLSQFINNFSFSVQNVFACGISFYFIKEEMPRIIIKSKLSKRS